MKKKSIIFLILLSVFLSFISYFVLKSKKNQENQPSSNKLETKKPNLNTTTAPFEEQLLKKILVTKKLENCQLSENLTLADFKSHEVLAKNIFYTKNGEEFVLRTFIKDSQEGSYHQLVLFKLVSGQAPILQEIKEQDQRNPTQEVLDSYIQEAEVTRIDSDQRFILKNGSELLLSFEGEAISKFVLYSPNGELLCHKEELLDNN